MANPANANADLVKDNLCQPALESKPDPLEAGKRQIGGDGGRQFERVVLAHRAL